MFIYKNMKGLSLILNKLILFKIISLEKNGRSYDETEVYKLIWGVLIILFTNTLAALYFFLGRVNSDFKHYRYIIVFFTVLLICGVTHAIIKKIKQHNYVYKCYSDYLNMDISLKRKSFKVGLLLIILIFSYPVLIMSILSFF